MEAGGRFLFLLTEGFDETVIDSQVVDTVVALRAEGLPFDILSLVDGRNWLDRRGYYAERRQEIAERTGGRVSLWPVVRKTQPSGLAVVVPALAAALGVGGLRRSLIHARGDWAARFGAALARVAPGVRVVYDCRGDGEAEFERAAQREGADPQEIAVSLERISAARARAVTGADHALCVSEPLRRLLVSRYGLEPERSSVIPCAADEGKFRPDANVRARQRAALGVEDRFVLVYPGRFGRWHYSEETLRVAGGVLAEHADAFFLILTPDLDAASELARRELPEGRYRIQKVRHEEVAAHLQAADLGILLREPDPINRVACPTKFAEFVMTGLPVLISPEIGDCSEFVDRHGAGAVLPEPVPQLAGRVVADLRLQPAEALRSRIADHGRETFSRQRHARELAGLYRRLPRRER